MDNPSSSGSLVSTAYSRVTEMIQRDIMNGSFAPQIRLKVNELAQRYGVSPSPVREALQQLQAEGLVVLLQNRGAMVRGIDMVEFAHMMHVRAAVEGMQARICASIADARMIERLETLAQQFERDIMDLDLETRRQTNHAFHHEINTADGNTVAVEVVQRVSSMMAAFRRAWPFGEKRFIAAAAEHHQILSAIRAGDGTAAEEAARLHVLNGLADIIDRMRADGAWEGDVPQSLTGARSTANRTGKKARP